MNKFKKIGLTALAASLVSVSAHAGSMSVAGSASITAEGYSGGIIITDWYSENPNESIKVTIRFLSNEVRSDAISIKIFYRKCKDLINCNISENEGNLGKELKKEILKRAAIYKKQTKDKNFKPYTGSSLK